MKKLGSDKFILLTIILLVAASINATASVRLLYTPSILLLSSTSVNSACDFSRPQDSVPVKKKEKKKKEKQSNTYMAKGKKISFETFDKNYERALKFYNNGQYLSAARLFEELYPLSLGTPRADSILFRFADCYYQNRDFEMAAFHFKDYTRKYPGTERAEEAHFMCVKAIYNISPYYSLDQFETNYAIEEIDIFIQLYPKSKYMDECNTMLDNLREKLAKKDFEVIKLYYNTGNYKAVQIATKNFLREYPYSQYVPEAMFILVKNNNEFAKKSVVNKQFERFQACLDAFDMLKTNYPESSFTAMAESIANDATKSIEKIIKKEKLKKSNS